jgi:hypothetical protein
VLQKSVLLVSSFTSAIVCALAIFFFGFWGLWSRAVFRFSKYQEKGIVAPSTQNIRESSQKIDVKAAELVLVQADEISKREAVARRIWSLGFMLDSAGRYAPAESAMDKAKIAIEYLAGLLYRFLYTFVRIIWKPIYPFIASIFVFFASYFAQFFSLFSSTLLTCQSFATMPELTGVASSFVQFQRISVTTLNFFYSLKILKYIGFYQFFSFGVDFMDWIAMSMDFATIESDITCSGSNSMLEILSLFVVLIFVVLIYESKCE